MTQRVVNYKYGTGNPVLPNGSIDVRDGIDNNQSFDVFMNADEDTYNQRDGEVVKTLAGAVRSVGIQRIGDFTVGCTVTARNQGVLYETDGAVYVWNGALPKVVPPASSPSTTGGVSPSGDWIDVGDASAYYRLTSELKMDSGANNYIGGLQTRRMSLAEAKTWSFIGGDVCYITDIGYSFQFKSSRQLIAGQLQSEMTFDDELHILIDSGGMLEFCDWKKLPAVESKNYANYQAKLRGRSDSVSVGAIGDSTTYCQALPSTAGSTNRNGQETGFGDGSTYDQWQFNNNWPKVLGEIMQSAAAGGASVTNLGFSGDRALTGYLRHRVATSNDATMIMFGINDVLYATSNGANPDQIYDSALYSLDNFQMIMRKLIARELVRGKSVVVLGTTVFGSLVGWDGTGYSANRLTEAYDSVSRSVSQEFGCQFVDIKGDILRQYKLTDILQEGTHLNEAGCKVMAGRLASVMLSKWKTPTIVTSTSTVLSNPNVTDMIGKGQNGVLPNSTSNAPPFQSNDPVTISITTTKPVFYPIYAAEDSLIVFPEMMGSAAGAQVTFRVNSGAILPAKLNPRELGTEPASSKAATISGTHVDESTQNHSQDGMFIALVAKGWHLLEVSKDSGSGSALLDSFQFYPEKEIREKHTRGLTATASAGNDRNWRASAASNGGGLYTISFTSPMANTTYHVEVEQISPYNGQFCRVYDKSASDFKLQFMSGAGAGSGINFSLQNPSDFSVRIYGGR